MARQEIAGTPLWARVGYFRVIFHLPSRFSTSPSTSNSANGPSTFSGGSAAPMQICSRLRYPRAGIAS